MKMILKTPQTTNRGQCHRRGESLFEILVVMSVLVGLASLGWPQLQTSLRKSELQSAARQISKDLSQARMKAMQTGIPYEFRYQPEQRTYEILAQQAPGAGEVAASSEGAPLEDKTTTEQPEPERIRREIAEGLKFVALAEVSNKAAETSAPLELASADTDWSRPIVFYPNGRSSPGMVELEGDREFRVEIRLNSLTGATNSTPAHKSSPKRTEDE